MRFADFEAFVLGRVQSRPVTVAVLGFKDLGFGVIGCPFPSVTVHKDDGERVDAVDE